MNYPDIDHDPLQRKEVARSSVRGVDIEFDSERLVSILCIPGNNDICEYIKEVEVEAQVEEVPDAPAVPAPDSAQQQEQATTGVDPSIPGRGLSDSEFAILQADFERARANRFQANLEKAQAENARLLALLQQAQSQPKP
ncbi:hypothetical protein Dimus_006434 [Dionaea muscipula]